MTTTAVESARLPMVEIDAVPEDVRTFFMRQRGNVPNLFRIAALRPPIVETLHAHMQAVMGEGTVSKLLKELVACRVSQTNECDYCLASHTKLVVAFGGQRDQVAALARGDYSGLEPGWREAIQYAVEIAAPKGRVSDDTFRDLKAHWSDEQIVEITCVATMFSYFNRFANALQIPITK
jgi:uncharacterized peroxidase-related enzyme